MNKVRLERIFHRDRWRYAIFTPYDREILKIIRSIPGIQYSGTYKCWYTNESEENMKIILRVFAGKADVDVSLLPALQEIKPPGNSSDIHPPARPSDDHSILPVVNTSSDKQDLVVPETIVHRENPNGRQEKDVQDKKFYGVRGYDAVEFRIVEGKLVVRFTGKYDGTWIDELKSYGRVQYDRIRKEFYLPWSKMIVDSLSDYFSGIGVEVRVIKEAVKPETKDSRKKFSDEIHSRELTGEGIEAIETLRWYLEENRYSKRTIESYTSVLEIFFRYFSMKHPDEIQQGDISDFMNEFIIKNGLSASYQNQAISAIKIYYEISGERNVVPGLLERPRRGRALPKVFSKEEVTRILNSAGNTKHKLLLWIIYSCGLRRSEATNILLTDIDRVRNIIHIREGKGGVDRIVPVPNKVWSKYDEYMESYHPSKYLFEGQSGGRYSAESVYNVFKHALHKAGIQKEVGVHSLRHSFATHLHENGLDIRFIQELLGHKSSRTTEIYTHVSRRNLAAIKSPIEDLDLK
jgi:integrase/recombinase XerD